MSSLLLKCCSTWIPLLLVLHRIARSTAQQQQLPSLTARGTPPTPAATVMAATPSPFPSEEDNSEDNHERVLLPLIAVLIGGLCVLLLVLSAVRFAVYKRRLWNARRIDRRAKKTLNEVGSTPHSAPCPQEADSSSGDRRSNVKSWAPYIDAQFLHPTYHNLKPLETKAAKVLAAGNTPQSYHCLNPLSMDYTHIYVKMAVKDCLKEEPSLVTEPAKRDYRGIEVSTLETPKVYSRPRTIFI